MRAMEFIEAMEEWQKIQPERPQTVLSELVPDDEGGFTGKDAYVTDEGCIFITSYHKPEGGFLKVDKKLELTREEALRLSEWIKEVYAD